MSRRPRHTPLSKSDQLAEGRQLFGQSKDSTVDHTTDLSDDEEEGEYEDVYLSFANLKRGEDRQVSSKTTKNMVICLLIVFTG